MFVKNNNKSPDKNNNAKNDQLHSFNKTLVSCLALFSFSATSIAAESIKQNYALTYQEEKITVDGIMDEDVWKEATKMVLKYENNPGDGVDATVSTEMYFYENGESLNVAIIAYDPNPELIRASLRDRDALWSDDNVGIVIDTFNDQRSGYEFFVNPLGAQADMRMDDTNGWDEDSSWDAIWASAGRITDIGYIVEMSIPFTALRFPQTDGTLTWNVAGLRNYPRDVRKQMATYKSDRNIKCNLCQFDQLAGFASIKTSNNFQLTPTLTISRKDEKPNVPGEWQDGDTDVDPGLDIRWGITQDMVLNVTVNPDFSQVEADSGQLDVNNTYSLFYPEKRPFFLDGASYFDTSNFNFVHTRNIAEPDVGIKLTGKTDQHSYGLMVANDKNTSFLMPGNSGSGIATLNEESDVAIARYKIDVGERNDIGVLVTNRESSHYNNTLVSVDGNYWFSQADSIRYQIARSESDNPTQVQEDFGVAKEQQGNAYSLRYSHQTRDYRLKADYTNVDENFRADLGFQSQANYEKLVLGGNRTWYGTEDDLLTEWGYFGDWDKTYDQDGKMLEQEYELFGEIQGPMQLYGNFGFTHREKFHDGEYFYENQIRSYFRFTPISGLKLQFFTRMGKQIDYANTQLGDVFNFETTVTWDANKHINLDFSHNYSQLDIGSKRLFTANQYDVRLGYQFNMRSILKLVVQYTDIDRDAGMYSYEDIEDRPHDTNRRFSTQLIYSYKINAQTLFFVGYSDGGFQDDNLNELERDQRTIFTKFSYAWLL
ncbi:MAG: carbohydrate binding family 9 domain-containing protein [Colwellia sp.]|nr:carbohydrate binding family 9 domain-containing protein [Colwellia sp.]